MKILKLFLMISMLSLFIWGCQENGRSGSDIINSNSSIIPDNDNPEDNETTNLKPALEEEIETSETVTGENDKDKYAGSTSYTSTGKTGFYDRINGVDREVYTNISGDITGNVQFMQTHNMEPNGNSMNNKPSIVAYRPALLLLRTNTFYKSISMEVSVGNKVYNVEMDPPSSLPESDSTRSDKQAVAFSNKTWSAYIPEKYMRAGLEIKFTALNNDNTSFSGLLSKDAIDFETPVEAVYVLLRLGVLENIPAYTSTDNYLFNESERALSEYYQTIPFGRMILSTYEQKKLDEVMASDGSIKTSGTNNDLYRFVVENQIGAGISLANKGVSNTMMNDEYENNKDARYYIISQVATSRPASTDNKSIISISYTSGNTFSKYLGYLYGLTDNVDINQTYFGSVHSYNTGWGYDSYKDRIRGNLAWNDNGSAITFEGYTINGFNGIYGWQKDPMSNGDDNSSISKYPYHTAYTAKKIQDNASNRYMISDIEYNGHYPYIYWNKTENVYKYVTDKEFLANRLEPTKKGVPVITLIGGYNLDNTTQSIIYPYFRANYGNVFGDLFVTELPSTNNYLKITYEDGSENYVDLGATVSGLRKFHINIAESSKPVKAVLVINGSEIKETVIPAIFDTELSKAVVVGKGYGYNMTIESDIDELSNYLTSYNEDNYILSDRAVEIYNNLKFNKKLDNITNENAKNIMTAYKTKQDEIVKIEKFISNNLNELELSNESKHDELKEMLASYDAKPVAYVGQMLRNTHYDKCFEVKTVNGIQQASAVECVDNKTEQLWFMDRYQRIRPISHPNLCMNNEMSSKGLTACNFWNDRKWRKHASYPEHNVFQNVGGYLNCLYYDASSKLYQRSCGGGINQQFTEMLNQKEAQRYNAKLVKIGTNRCISVSDNITDNKTITTMTCPSDSADNETLHWFIDANHRIHSAKHTSYCLEVMSNNKIGIALCSDSTNQKWVKKENLNSYESFGNTGKCIDDYTSEKRLGIWDCKTNASSNQVFSEEIPVETNKAVSTFDGNLLEKLDRLLY